MITLKELQEHQWRVQDSTGMWSPEHIQMVIAVALAERLEAIARALNEIQGHLRVVTESTSRPMSKEELDKWLEEHRA